MLRSAWIVLLLISGCAGTRQEPIVDMKGVDLAQYDKDLAECKAYEDQVQSGRKVAGGAAGGAVVGGVIGAIIGSSGTAVRGAGVGAVVGGAKGAGGAARERHQVLRNCLKERGYKVLN